jgi:hypothetical protein
LKVAQSPFESTLIVVIVLIINLSMIILHAAADSGGYHCI